jgi:anti-sigma factor RsiW
MTRQSFSAPWSDEAIVAWLDGEMRDDERRAFDQQLNDDADLAARVERLMQSNQPWEQAFAPLLEEAPVSRMEQKLNVLLHQPVNVKPQAKGVSRRSLIAASLSFLAVGVLAGRFIRPGEQKLSGEPEIRDLIAQYMSLYSAETLADINVTPQGLQSGLNRMQQDIGLTLTQAAVEIPEAELKSVRMLRYDSTSIAQMAYLHASFGPMALCISRSKTSDSTALKHEVRRGLNLVWWRSKGYEYVLTGRNPQQDLQQSGELLQQRLV